MNPVELPPGGGYAPLCRPAIGGLPRKPGGRTIGQRPSWFSHPDGASCGRPAPLPVLSPEARVARPRSSRSRLGPCLSESFTHRTCAWSARLPSE